MDKKEFLSGLEGALSVLEEDELRDIISEYEQHIDMKVGKGLTEEEAIADFGSFEELTAELLEAYHVRADYKSDTGRAGRKPDREGIEKGLRILERRKKAGKDFSIGERLKAVAEGILSKARWFFCQCTRPIVWMKRRWNKGSKETDRMQRRKEERKTTKEMGIGIRGVAGTIGKGMGNLFGFTIDMMLWGIRLVWNSCWFLFSMFMIGCGLFGLYGLGVLAILLMQGYPLIGVLVGCLGIVLCTFSAAGLGISFLYRRKAAATGSVVPEEEDRFTDKPSETGVRRRRVWIDGMQKETHKKDGEEE